MNKLNNPWRNGAFAEAVATLEKAGIKPPKSFETIAEILRILDDIEREDARREEVWKASEAFRKQQS